MWSSPSCWSGYVRLPGTPRGKGSWGIRSLPPGTGEAAALAHSERGTDGEGGATEPLPGAPPELGRAHGVPAAGRRRAFRQRVYGRAPPRPAVNVINLGIVTSPPVAPEMSVTSPVVRVPGDLYVAANQSQRGLLPCQVEPSAPPGAGQMGSSLPRTGGDEPRSPSLGIPRTSGTPRCPWLLVSPAGGAILLAPGPPGAGWCPVRGQARSGPEPHPLIPSCLSVRSTASK